VPSKTVLAALAAPVALPVLLTTLFLGAGGMEPAPPGTAGQVCTVQATATPSGAGPSASASLAGGQVELARVIVAGAKTLALPAGQAQRAAAIGLMTAMQESSLSNPPGGDRDSIGLFQQRPSQGWGTPAQLADPGYQSGQFLSRLVAVPGWDTMAMWQAAQAVQHSADGTLYAQWEPLAVATAAALFAGTTGTLVCAPPPTPAGGTATGTASGTTTGTTPGTAAGPLPAPDSQAAATALAYAQAQLGKPYIWGGTGPEGYDCSGLTLMAYRQAGIELPRTSEYQWSAGPHLTQDQLQPGDLVFYNPGEDGLPGLPGHVGIYLGNGMMLHAPHPGDVVRVAPVNDGDTYLGAIRPGGGTSRP